MAKTENTRSALIWITLMAMFTAVEPVTPRWAMYATPSENNTATTISNIVPGFEALMKFGYNVPTM